MLRLPFVLDLCVRGENRRCPVNGVSFSKSKKWLLSYQLRIDTPFLAMRKDRFMPQVAMNPRILNIKKPKFNASLVLLAFSV